MQRFSRHIVAFLVVLATVLSLNLTAPTTVNAADKTACASELGLTRPNSQDAAAKTPVILVHGLWSKESDLAVFDRAVTPGNGVSYRFNYDQSNDRWVTEGTTAHRLAKTIVCYSRLYGDKKVVIVAHSMGGLLVRAALDWAAYGTFAKSVTGHVVTVGTPHKGAPMGGFSYVSNISLCQATFAWWGNEAGKTCQANESSKAVSAMRPNSPELAALPRFPKGISVRAIAGNVSTKTCLGWSCTPEYLTGADLVVPVSSALDGATHDGVADGQKVFECYDSVALPNVSNPWCGHNGMLSAPQVQADVKSSIQRYIASVQQAAPAPAAEQPAKTLRLGDLAVPARKAWEGSSARSILDTATCRDTSEDYWKLCAYVYLDPDGNSLKEVWDMLCADRLLSTSKSTIGGKAATLYKYGRCDARESMGTAYLWRVPGGPGIEYHLSSMGQPMAGIEKALASAVWK